MTAAPGRRHNVALSEVPLNAGCVPFGWELIVSKTKNTADIYTVGEETIVSEVWHAAAWSSAATPTPLVCFAFRGDRLAHHSNQPPIELEARHEDRTHGRDRVRRNPTFWRNWSPMATK